jgi:hypothetical protein
MIQFLPTATLFAAASACLTAESVIQLFTNLAALHRFITHPIKTDDTGFGFGCV